MGNPSKKKQVFCVKLKREAEALPAPPFPTPLGLRIFENVSKAGWEGWIAHQTMLVNENRLSLSEASARNYLKEQMEQYFFGSGSDIPAGYTPTSLRKPTG